jgi:hypothetical protein
MSWTFENDYSLDRDKVRLLVGDTDTNEQLVADEAIAWALTEEGSIYLASATIAESIASTFARKVDFTSGDESMKCSQMAENYMKKATDLRKRANKKTFVSPYAGGLSKAEKLDSSQSDDLVKPEFKKDMFNNPSGDLEEECRY